MIQEKNEVQLLLDELRCSKLEVETQVSSGRVQANGSFCVVKLTFSSHQVAVY